MGELLSHRFPQVGTKSASDIECRRKGFKFNKLHNQWTSSSIAVAKRELDFDVFPKFLNRVIAWNTLQVPERVDPKFLPKLRDYQKAGVRQLMRSKSVLLGDEMGLGKTIQCAVALSSIQASAVVVCPNHLVQNWIEELGAWTQGLEIVDCTDVSKHKWGKILSNTVRVLPYSQVHKLNDVECGVLIADECHMLNSGGSRRTKGVHGISAKQRWFLSGTAFKNHPTELWSQFVLLGVSEFMGGSKSGYELGFGLSDLIEEVKLKGRSTGFARPKPRSIPTHLKPKEVLEPEVLDLLSVAMSPFYLRRDKAKHLDLPPKVRTFYRLGKAGALERKQAQKFQALDLDELQTPDHVSEIAPLRIESALKLIRSKDFQEYSEKLINHPSIVFAYHNDVLGELEEFFQSRHVPFMTITKGDNPLQVQKSAKWFQSTIRGVLIVSIKKGSTGLTLTNAKRLCFVELDWTVAELDQCESRVHRYGKNENTLIDYVLTKGGMDDLVLNKLQMKETNNEVLVEK